MRPQILTLLLLAVLAVSAQAIQSEASNLIGWREEVNRAAQLLENDVPRAVEQAQRLFASQPAEATPADQVRILNVLARSHTYSANIGEADRRAGEAYKLAQLHQDRIGQAEANLSITLNAINEGRIDKARQAAAEALNLLEGADRPELLVEAMLRTASMYMRHNQTSAALAMAMQAHDIARQSAQPRALALAYFALALAQSQSGQYAQAGDNYREMLKQAHAAESRLLEVLAGNGIANSTSSLGDPRGAEMLQRQTITLARQLGSPSTLGHVIFGLSSFLRDQGRHEESLVQLNELEQIYRAPLNRIGLWWILNTRAADQLSLGRLDAAAADAMAAHALAEEITFPIYLAESGKRLAAVAAAQGNHLQAYNHRLQADIMEKKADQERLSELIVDMSERYQSEAKQRQINELTRRENERSRQLLVTWTVLAATLATLAVTLWAALRLRRSRLEIQRLNSGLEQRVQARTDELRQQARYLRTLVDTLPLTIWLKDTNGRYLIVKAVGGSMKGRTTKDMIGRTDAEIWPDKIGTAHRDSDIEAMAGNGSWTGESCWIDADGERIVWVEIDKAPVTDDDGTVLGTVGVVREISARKIVETAREQALAEAERLAHARHTFLAQMSHELRTPLNGILGYTQTLLARPGLDERQRADLSIIWRSGEHLLMLIGDILDFARIDAGKIELHPGDFQLAPFLAAIVDIVDVRADQKGVALVSTFAPDLPASIRTDELRLRQVLLNLLSNAIKFTDSGGHVRLETALASPNRLSFTVTDSGTGIDREQFENIFQPFEQTGDPGKRQGGAGLGLPISRAFVRLMGGDIELDSEPGVGSSFRFTIDIETPSGDMLSPLPSPPVSTSDITPASPPTLVVPPTAELETLHELALQGSMRDILEFADHLDDRYTGFAEQLRGLARQYRSRAIQELVEHHLPPKKEKP